MSLVRACTFSGAVDATCGQQGRQRARKLSARALSVSKSNKLGARRKAPGPWWLRAPPQASWVPATCPGPRFLPPWTGEQCRLSLLGLLRNRVPVGAQEPCRHECGCSCSVPDVWFRSRHRHGSPVVYPPRLFVNLLRQVQSSRNSVEFGAASCYCALDAGRAPGTARPWVSPGCMSVP